MMNVIIQQFGRDFSRDFSRDLNSVYFRIYLVTGTLLAGLQRTDTVDGNQVFHSDRCTPEKRGIKAE